MKNLSAQKQLIKDFAQGRVYDADLLNITFWIVKQGYATVEDESDVSIIYDNLLINSEIINIDTINDFDKDQIEEISHHRYSWVKSQVEKGYFFLLDFYTTNPQDHKVGCFLKFKSGYDALDL